MIPIKDDVRRNRIPIVTWLIIALNVWIFFSQINLPRRLLMSIYYNYGLVPAAFLNPSIQQQGGFFTLVTSMFFHGSFGHLLGNMWSLWLFGDNVEDRMGRLSFLLFYILAGVAAGFFHVFTNPASAVPTIGASGAIAGVMAAYLFLFPTARVLTLIPLFFIPYFISVPSFVFIGFWFLTQVYYGTTTLGTQEYGGIAWWAHIGGFIFGAVFYRYFYRKFYI